MSNLNVATTIRNQLGNRFCVMTGANTFVGSDRSLTFKIGRNARNVTHVRVTLNVCDLYDIEYLSVRAGKVNARKVQASFGVYADNMANTIGDACGLAVTL